jgi:hypothetical protein
MYEVWGFGKFCELREVRKFGKSGGWEALGGRKVWQDVLAGNKCILQLHVDCVGYISVDYRTERLVHSIRVEIHINISTYIYYSVVHHVRILHKSISGTRTQPLFSSRDENWEGGKVGRLRRQERLGA